MNAIFSPPKALHSSEERQRAGLRVRSPAFRISGGALDRLSGWTVLQAAYDSQFHRFVVAVRSYSEHDRERETKRASHGCALGEEEERALRFVQL